MQKLQEGVKLDTALYPTTGATSLTGGYFPMDKFRKALFHLMCKDQVDGESFLFAVYEATSAAGAGAQQLGANVTMTQGAKVNAASVQMNTVSVNDTVIITFYKMLAGVLTAQTALTFTAKAAESLANRQFNQAAGNDACATSLAACINSAAYGVDGLTAVAVTDTVTISCTVPGEGVFDITELAAAVARVIVVDLEQQAYFAVEADELTDGFTHVGARVTSVDAATEFACSLLRSMPRYAPVGQSVAAYDDSE
jgi:hypothetical protein